MNLIFSDQVTLALTSYESEDQNWLCACSDNPNPTECGDEQEPNSQSEEEAGKDGGEEGASEDGKVEGIKARRDRRNILPKIYEIDDSEEDEEGESDKSEKEQEIDDREESEEGEPDKSEKSQEEEQGVDGEMACNGGSIGKWGQYSFEELNWESDPLAAAGLWHALRLVVCLCTRTMLSAHTDGFCPQVLCSVCNVAITPMSLCGETRPGRPTDRLDLQSVSLVL